MILGLDESGLGDWLAVHSELLGFWSSFGQKKGAESSEAEHYEGNVGLYGEEKGQPDDVGVAVHLLSCGDKNDSYGDGDNAQAEQS